MQRFQRACQRLFSLLAQGLQPRTSGERVRAADVVAWFGSTATRSCVME